MSHDCCSFFGVLSLDSRCAKTCPGSAGLFVGTVTAFHLGGGPGRRPSRALFQVVCAHQKRRAHMNLNLLLRRIDTLVGILSLALHSIHCFELASVPWPLEYLSPSQHMAGQCVSGCSWLRSR